MNHSSIYITYSFFLLGAFGWLGISMGCLDMSKSCHMSIEYVFIFTHNIEFG